MQCCPSPAAAAAAYHIVAQLSSGHQVQGAEEDLLVSPSSEQEDLAAAVHLARHLAGQEVEPRTGVQLPDLRILLGHQDQSAESLLVQLQDLLSLAAALDPRVLASEASSLDHSAWDPLVSAELGQPAEEVGPCIAQVRLLAVVAMAA